jgi:hypothetical protein
MVTVAATKAAPGRNCAANGGTVEITSYVKIPGGHTRPPPPNPGLVSSP